MKFDFNANRQVVEKTYNLGKGEYLKVKDGDNKVRLVSECIPHAGEYKGKSTFKWLCQVIDLSDGKVKPYFMPDGVYKQILSLQMDEDYAFDEVPMPYNINVITEDAGLLTAKYRVRPSPKHLALTPEQEEALKQALSVQEIQAKIRENDEEKLSTNVVTKEEAQSQMEDEINISEIPF